MTVISEGTFCMICPLPDAKSLEQALISQRSRGWQPVMPCQSRERTHGDRGRRPAAKESHSRDRAGPLATVGRGTHGAHCASEFGNRAAAGGCRQKARLEGSREQFFQVLENIALCVAVMPGLRAGHPRLGLTTAEDVDGPRA